jgi:predicted XRE-type DNA-binding protein
VAISAMLSSCACMMMPPISTPPMYTPCTASSRPLAINVHPVYGVDNRVGKVMMKLHAWMTQNKLDDADVAEIAGISRVSINRLRRGVHLPSWDTMNRLAAATDNEVMPNDFLESAYQKS